MKLVTYAGGLDTIGYQQDHLISSSPMNRLFLVTFPAKAWSYSPSMSA